MKVDILEMNQVELKPRHDLHIARRLWHVCGVLSIVTIYSFISYQLSLVLLLFAALVFALPDFYRLVNPKFNAFVLKNFRMLLRDNEAQGLTGLSYIILGVFIIAALFPKPVVTLSLLFVAFGDPAASIFGVLYGKDKIWGNKSLQGFLAAFVVCTLLTAAFFIYHQQIGDRLVLAALISGFIGACSEIVTIRKLDDNLTFPVLSATFLWVLFRIFGAFAG